MNWKFWERKHETPVSVVPKRGVKEGLVMALRKAQTSVQPTQFPIQAPKLPPGVVPLGKTAPVMAMDTSYGNDYNYGAYGVGVDFTGFPGYPYLAMLATRSEYRAFASAISKEMTREWITITSSETAGDGTKNKVTELTKALNDLKLKTIIQRVFELDSYYGRGQIAIEIVGQNQRLPLKLSNKTIPRNAVIRLSVVEPMWTTPAMYNAIDPMAPDFYKPSRWYMLGQEIHASRLLTIVTRPLPDMLKPAFNFGGMSMSQLAEPYVNNWLRTRQSIADLIDNFSTTVLATDMGQVLSEEECDADAPSEAANNLFNRIGFFTALRSNRGVMVVDKDTEEIQKHDTSLGTLDALQAQSQEHMCAPAHMPAVVLTGIEPTGLNVSSEGTMTAWHDWVRAEQESNAREPITVIFNILQLSMYGEIDEDLGFIFNSLYQMTPKEKAEIRKSDAEAAGTYIDRQVIAPDEERQRLARDPDSGYHGLSGKIEVTEDDSNDPEDDE